MNFERKNKILMKMGGDNCRASHLLKNNFCTEQELFQMEEEGLIKFVNVENEEYIHKTAEGKKIW